MLKTWTCEIYLYIRRSDHENPTMETRFSSILWASLHKLKGIQLSFFQAHGKYRIRHLLAKKEVCKWKILRLSCLSRNEFLTIQGKWAGSEERLFYKRNSVSDRMQDRTKTPKSASAKSENYKCVERNSILDSIRLKSPTVCILRF